MIFTNKRKGNKGERRISKMLRHWCRKNHGKLLCGIYLPLYDGCCELDHLVLGSFGVLAVETKTLAGTLSGDPCDRELIHRVGRNIHKMYNPLYQNRTHTENLRHHLKKAGMGNIPVYGEVVYAGECVPPKALGLSPDELMRRLSQFSDAGANPKALKKLFQKISVKSPLKKLRHRFLARKKAV